MNEENKKIEEKITSLIKSGDVKMKPKWYFSIRAILGVIMLCLLFFFMIYILSLIDLILDDQYKLHLNNLGIVETFFALPWLLVLIGVMMLVIFDGLIKKYSFSYRNPFLYTFLVVLVLLLIISSIIKSVDEETRFSRFGEDPKVPVFGPIHRYYRGAPEVRPKRQKHRRQVDFLIITTEPNFKK